MHAEEQVATFRTVQKLDLHKIVKGLNALLPREVRVFGCDIVESSFHPMHSSTGKVYRYTFWNHSGEMVPYSKHAWQVPISLSPNQIQVLKRVFEGEHDFSAFCSSDSSAINKVRIIFGLRFYQSGPLTEMWIHGSGFLKQMVRIIAGSVKSFSDGKIDERGLVSLMKSKDRTLAPQTAPAMGLTLMKVCFDGDFSLHDWFDQYEGRGSLVLKHRLEKNRS